MLAGPLWAESQQKIADRLYQIEQMGGDHLGYSSFILNYLRKQHNVLPKGYKHRYRGTFRQREIDTYSLFSGGLAIRESIQLHSIKASQPGAASINVNTLVGPVIKSHNYEEMLQGKKPRFFKLAEYAPVIFIICILTTWGGPSTFSIT